MSASPGLSVAKKKDCKWSSDATSCGAMYPGRQWRELNVLQQLTVLPTSFVLVPSMPHTRAVHATGDGRPSIPRAKLGRKGPRTESLISTMQQ